MNSLRTSRNRMTLDAAMQFVRARWTGTPHITFDPEVRAQYLIRRASSHDGTILFSMELLRDALTPLLEFSSYYKPMGEPPHGMIPKYTIGRIKLFSVFGTVDVPAGRIKGLRECVVIPVRCEYVPFAA